MTEPLEPYELDNVHLMFSNRESLADVAGEFEISQHQLLKQYAKWAQTKSSAPFRWMRDNGVPQNVRARIKKYITKTPTAALDAIHEQYARTGLMTAALREHSSDPEGARRDYARYLDRWIREERPRHLNLWADKHGLNVRKMRFAVHRKGMHPIDLGFLKKRFYEGAVLKDVAQEMGFTQSHLSVTCRKHGFERQLPGAWPLETRQWVRMLVKMGFSRTQAAKHMNVPATTVDNWYRGDPGSTRKTYDPAFKQQVVDILGRKSVKAASKIYGVPETTIRTWARCAPHA